MKAKPWVWSESIIYCVDLFNFIFIGLPDLRAVWSAELDRSWSRAFINPELRSCFLLTRDGDTALRPTPRSRSRSYNHQTSPAEIWKHPLFH